MLPESPGGHCLSRYGALPRGVVWSGPWVASKVDSPQNDLEQGPLPRRLWPSLPGAWTQTCRDSQEGALVTSEQPAKAGRWRGARVGPFLDMVLGMEWASEEPQGRGAKLQEAPSDQSWAPRHGALEQRLWESGQRLGSSRCQLS